MQITLLFVILVPQIVVESPDHFFHANVEYYPGTELIARSLTLMHDQTVIFTKSEPRGSTFLINRSGTVFGIGADALYFYDHQGNEVLLQQLNAPNGFGFSPDNSIFIASDLSGLCIYDRDGKLNYSLPSCRLFACSDGAEIVATVTSDSLFVYEKGSRIYSAVLSSPYVRSIAINEDNRSIQLHLPAAVEECTYETKAGEK